MLIDFSANPRKAYGLMTSAIAPRPIAWVSTRSKDGIVNLAPFSFFQMVTGTPPTLMISPLLQSDGSLKDTTRNIIETGEFVVNLVSYALRGKMNETSFSFPADVSEIEQCGIATLAAERVQPPRVAGAPVSFECKVASVQPYPADKPSCHIILGEVLVAHIDDRVLDEHGHIDPRKLDLISRMGGDWYGRIDSDDNFQMVRPQGWDKPVPTSTPPTSMDEAMRLHAAARYAEAESIYRQILTTDPTQSDATGMLGWLLHQTGRREQGLPMMRKAVNTQPNNHVLVRNLGAALREEGVLDEAIVYSKKACQIEPRYAEAQFDLAECYRMQNKLADAEQVYQEAVRHKPDYIDAWVHLGLVQQLQREFDAAEISITRALALNPLLVQAHMNLGVLYHARDMHEPAIASYLRAVQLDPRLTVAHYNLSVLLHDVGRHAEAEASCRRALALDPGYADAHFSLATLLLQKGDFAQGWREYEYRWLLKNAKKIVEPQAPLWDGVADLHGKTILIHVEQGLGDTVQFARYAKLLAERDAIVWAAVSDTMRILMQRCVGVSAVFCSADELPPDYDYHCPMLSLPLLFGTDLSSIPADVPYLSSDPIVSSEWAQRIGKTAALRVGLVWAGGQHNDVDMAYAIDRLRSLHLDQLHPLLEIEGVEFFSLQLGDAVQAQLAKYPKIIDYTGLIHDFHDTAALIDNLDLVISVDTSVAHLAGALGKPVWMLNRFNSCWRWLRDRSDSPWYPSMRIFQQPRFGDWSGVVDEVTQALREMVGEAGSGTQHVEVGPDMQQALMHHQAGRLLEAEALYRQVLTAQPRHADALHYLGMLAHQSGRQEESIHLIQQAIDTDSRNALYHFNLGTIYRQSGDFAASIASYKQAIALKDNFVDAYYKLGISYQQARLLPEAEASYRQVIVLSSDHAGAHNNLGNVLQDIGRAVEAEACYRQALRINPNFADAYLNFGNLLKATGNLRDAEMNYRMALELQPNYTKAHSNLGVLLVQQERFGEAEQSYQQALALQPDSVDIHMNLGFAMVEQHRFAEAEQYFRGVLRLQPEFAEAYNDLGIVLREQDKFEEAEAAFRKALALRPTLLVAYNHLGNLLKQTFRFDEAYEAYSAAMKIDSDFASAHSNLGVLMQEQSRPVEAEAHLRRALQIDPDFVFAHHNLAIVLRDQGRLDEAEASCIHAIRLDPGHIEAQFHLAFLLLQKGDFDRGWLQFEYRWQLDSADHVLELSEPLWDGKADIAGKKILLYAEQGYGDTLQMCRYAKLVAERGATVMLIVPQELKSLMAHCAGVDAVFSSEVEIPSRFDYQSPLMSLPLAFGTTLESIPADIPYLSCDPALVHQWQVQIGERKGLRVGLVWAGNPRKSLPNTQIVDIQRSLHFTQLKPLLKVEGIEFFSLQMGEEAQAQLAKHPQVNDYTGLIRDFHDTAALIDNLDLVISVDTSVAHLAGALGKPIWMLNRFNSCWRWLLDRNDSPWYPSMRIFRQSSFGDWDGVIDEVAKALRELAGTSESEAAQTESDSGQMAANMHQALMHHQAGCLPEAEVLYRQVLAVQPRHADALHYLGMLAYQRGSSREAIDLIQQAIAIDSSNALYPYNLGTIYRQSGDLAASIASYKQAIALKDNFADVHYKLGLSYQQAGQLSEAEACYRKVIALSSDHVGAYNNLGSVLQDMGRMVEAEASYRQALRINPNFADAYLNFGNLLKDGGKLRDAEMNYRMALELQPNYTKAHNNLGVLLMQQQRFVEAEQSYRLALALQPDSVEIHSNLGFAMVEQHRFAEAEQYFRAALRLQPEFAEAYNNLGIVLREQDKLEESEAAFRKVLQLNPSFGSAYNNLGNLLRESGRLEEAEVYYLDALRLRPDYHDARMNYSFSLLQRGDFLRGWEEYESRWHTRGFESPHVFAQPLWNGIGDLRGKAILIHAEQGFGDTLQFVRYAALLQQRGAIVYALVPVELKPLLSTCEAITVVIAPGDVLPPFDWHCPMMSLPRVLKTEVASIPNQVPYLAASQISIERWRKLLGTKTALRVGLVWAGSPRKNQPAAQLIDRRRSMAFDTIKPLLKVQGVQFVSLQLGEDARAQIDTKARLLDVSHELRDFEETAALIANLDLVISVDTAVAHLAGALNKPVWLLNRFNTCWRWFSDRTDSPWYPSMRIFRQPVMGDWTSVIAEVQTELKRLAAPSATGTQQTRVKRKKKR